MKLDSADIAKIVRGALAEDIGPGDVTTQCTVPEDLESCGIIVSKGEGILAGQDIACEVYRQVDDRIDYVRLVEEGRPVHRGDVLAEVSGPARGLLTAERTALNFLQRLSGIATITHQYVQAVAGTGAVVLDTRKTTPGLRSFEKYAVTVGGGHNHRAGLYDMVLIKDNHLRIAGGVAKAVAQCKKRESGIFVEVEVRTLAEVKEAVEVGVDRIMLDNMEHDMIRQAVTFIRKSTLGTKRIEIEASGGIEVERVRDVAETGVDCISIGAVTHSARALDISFTLT